MHNQSLTTGMQRGRVAGSRGGSTQLCRTLTDSTTLNRSPAVTVDPTSGSSTYTRSPSSSCSGQAGEEGCAAEQACSRAGRSAHPPAAAARPPTHLGKVGNAHNRGVPLQLHPLVVLGVLEALQHCSKRQSSHPLIACLPPRGPHWVRWPVIAPRHPPVAYPRTASDRSVELLSASRGAPQRRPRPPTAFLAKAARAMAIGQGEMGCGGPGRRHQNAPSPCFPPPQFFPCEGAPGSSRHSTPPGQCLRTPG